MGARSLRCASSPFAFPQALPIAQPHPSQRNAGTANAVERAGYPISDRVVSSIADGRRGRGSYPAQCGADGDASDLRQQQCAHHRPHRFALGSGQGRWRRVEAHLYLVGHRRARRRNGDLQRQRRQCGEERHGHVRQGRHVPVVGQDRGRHGSLDNQHEVHQRVVHAGEHRREHVHRPGRHCRLGAEWWRGQARRWWPKGWTSSAMPCSRSPASPGPPPRPPAVRRSQL